MTADPGDGELVAAAPVRSRLWMRRKKGYAPNLDATVLAPNVTHLQMQSSQAAISDDYDVFEVIGKGSTGKVYRACRRKDGEQVALKVVSTVNDDGQAMIAKAEFSLLQRMSHPSIVRALEFFEVPGNAVLVLTLFDGSPLSVTVKREHRLSEETARKLFVQLLQALDYLHQNRIVHRDVKPANVLISHNLTDLKLIDFNIGRYLPEGGALSPECTRSYAAPEVKNGRAPGEASDIWGAGLCLCMMLFGHCPPASVRDSHAALDGLDLSSVSEPAVATLRQCLVVEHSMRPAATTLLQMPWMPPEAALWDWPPPTPLDPQRFASGDQISVPIRAWEPASLPHDPRKIASAKVRSKRTPTLRYKVNLCAMLRESLEACHSIKQPALTKRLSIRSSEESSSC